MKVFRKLLPFLTVVVLLYPATYSSAQTKPAAGKETNKNPVENKWQEFTSTAQGFKVLFPSKPVENTTTIVSPDWGEIPLFSYAYGDDNAAYLIIFGQTPLQELKSIAECVAILRRAYVHGDEIMSYRETSTNNLASIEWLARNPYGKNKDTILYGRATINPRNGRLWVINFGAKNQFAFDEFAKERQRFVGSFKLLP